MIQYMDFISSEEYLGLRRKVKWFEFPVEEAQAGIDNSYMVKCASYKVKMCLLAAKGKEPFYEKLGFVERPNDRLGAGMDQLFILEE